MMSNNLTYIHAVAGKIQNLSFNNQEGNRISYTSIHENTAMDLILEVNDRCQLVSYLIKTHYRDSLPRLSRNSTPMVLPFSGEWYVEWGGFTIADNYHNSHRNMKGAIDFTIRDESGAAYSGSGKKNQDYYAFGKSVSAPCEAVVVRVIDGIEDNKVGKSNAINTYGNTVILETEQREYVLLAHLKNGSIEVKEGQKVSAGTVLAQCGNSGYSKEPHLHFALQNVPDIFHPTGAHCYFSSIRVDGQIKQDHSPVKGEWVSN